MQTNEKVIAIGNFDGVHAGHRALMGKACEIGAAHVLTFEPHPRQFFVPDLPSFRLTPWHQKKELLIAAGASSVTALDFDTALAGMSAEDFIQEILIKKLQAGHVVVGEDFTFGKNRTGNVDLLKKHIPVTALSPVRDELGEIYSSTRVREKITEKDFSGAAKILGRHWTLQSPVIHGEKRGRELGYPTANQNVTDYLAMPYGVYAVDVIIEGETEWRRGAANFGIRPMFETAQPLLETHILDFSDDIYGKNMEVKPLAYLRPEMKFDGLQALILQMKKDCDAARGVLS